MHYSMDKIGTQSVLEGPVCSRRLHTGPSRTDCWSSLRKLLDSNLCAHLGHLLGLFLRDALFNGLGRLINDRFGLLESQTGEFAHDLDDVDLVRTNLTEDGIEFGLLLDGSCLLGGGSGGSRSSGGRDRGCAHPPALL